VAWPWMTWKSLTAEEQERRLGKWRRDMVRRQIERRGVRDPAVLAALRSVPRHRFLPPALWRHAYRDRPLPIGHSQTISQPYIVALMTEALHVAAGDRILEIGTGSGYQAAVLTELGCEVFTIEILEPLAQRARQALEALGYASVRVRRGDGYGGWPEAAPFDAIILTAAPRRVPPLLAGQLKTGGRMVLPLGDEVQDLCVCLRTPRGLAHELILHVRFVPMTGRAADEWAQPS